MKVAIIDDDDGIRALLAELVVMRGHEAVTFATAEDALACLPDDPPALLLVDRLLPGVDGLELCRRVRAAQWGKNSMLIVMTARSVHAELAAALDSGADDFLAKPFDLELLAVRMTIAERQVALMAAHTAAEAVHRASEKRYQIIGELTSGFAYAFHLQPDGTQAREWAMGAVAHITGYTPEELDTDNGWDRLIHPADLQMFQRRTEELCARSTKVTEFRVRTKCGDIRWLREHLSLQRLEAGEAYAGHATVRDITAAKEAEARIRFQSHLLDTIGQAVVGTDLDRAITYWNRAAESLYGWTAADIQGSSILVLRFLMDCGEQDAVILAHLLRGEIWEGEILMQRRDSTRFPALVSVAPVYDELQEVVGTIAVSTDITARKRVEDALRETSTRLTTVLESITDALFTVDPTWHVTYVNPEAHRLAFGNAEDPIGRNLWEIFPEGIGTPFEDEYRRALETGFTASFEEYYAPLGLWLSVRAYPSVDGLSVYFQDVSARKQAEVALKLAYDTTIEGWARALDLRDHPTEGHSRRVTDLAVTLAQALGMGDSDLVHLRRGALLHDIGKVGIPDAILNKPGKLTEDEWAVMRLHPMHAYNLLSPISYLRPALDIPYCHHEKWDGTGYPLGLREGQIPLAARIFAVVDVWDALTADRPYRPAWSSDRAREEIAAQAGSHFDPAVIEAFLALELA